MLASIRSAFDALTRRLTGSSRTAPSSGSQHAAAKAETRTGWREFHTNVEMMFAAQGYVIVQAAGEAPHRDVDIILRKDRETFLVQCKQWRDAKVGVDALQSLFGIMKARGALGGFIVTHGRFSREAVVFASGANIRGIDGPALDAAVKKAASRGVGRTLG